MVDMTTEDPLSPIEARALMLQAGLDRIDQGLTLFDKDLKLVAGNLTFARLLDFPETLMQIGTPFEAFMRYNAQRGEYGPGDIEQLVAERVAAARRFQPHYAERVRPSGQIIAIRGEPLPNLGFITLYTDVTAQREAERVIRERNSDLEQRVQERTHELEAAYERLRAINQLNQQIAEDLRRSEARLRLITDAIPARIAYIDENRRYGFANRGYVEWFKRTKDLLIGAKVAEVLGADLYREIGPHIEHAMDGEAVSFDYAVRPDPDHAERYTHSELVPEIDAKGRVRGVFVLSTDITEQRRTQATLMQAQKMEAVGQLAGGIAHDLNNMLTVVMGNLSVLEERIGGSRDADELVAPALLATQRSAALIKRLLGFSQQQPLEPGPVDLHALVDGMRTLLRRTLPENIALTVDFGEPITHAVTDAHQLENALLNLCLNARDAMPSGGALILAVEMDEVTTKTAQKLRLQAGRYVRISITDNGCGMDEATLMRACEPFFTTKGFGSGSGLGLSMVYGFAQQSGGALAINSASGKGTCVSLYLPATEELLVETEKDVQVAAGPGIRKALVLLVEDDAEVRRVLRRQLLELGHAVIEATDGREALTMLEQVHEIDVVVSDVVMPGGIDGPTLARSVRANRPEIGILLVSGYEPEGDATTEFRLLGKPFSKSDLAAAMSEFLS